ncbi:MAG TPA: LmeA family phospholipid-binding protein [Abditibacterium sp.]|jgi:hypothetical protein
MGYLLAVLLGGFFAFNAAVTPQKAARVAEKALQKQYPTAKVNVEIEGKRGKSVLNGNFRRVRIEIADVTLQDLPFSPLSAPKKLARAGKIELEMRNLVWLGLPLSRANFDFDNVAYDFDALKNRSQFQIVGMDSGKMRLQLSAQSLKPSFEARLKDLEQVAISVEGDQFRLAAARDVVGFKTPIILTARLSGQSNQVRLEDPSVSVGGVKLPTMAASALLKDVNPVYTFDRDGKWPFAINLTGVSGQGDMLNVEATLQLKRPEQNLGQAKQGQ